MRELVELLMNETRDIVKKRYENKDLENDSSVTNALHPVQDR